MCETTQYLPLYLGYNVTNESPDHHDCVQNLVQVSILPSTNYLIFLVITTKSVTDTLENICKEL